MHELPITESILEIALKHAEASGAVRITDIYIVIGQLSSVVDDSVQFYWDFVSEGTIAEGAELHFKRISTELTCLECGARYQPPQGQLACAACGSLRVRVEKGQEFYVDSIAVEDQLSRGP